MKSTITEATLPIYTLLFLIQGDMCHQEICCQWGSTSRESETGMDWRQNRMNLCDTGIHCILNLSPRLDISPAGASQLHKYKTGRDQLNPHQNPIQIPGTSVKFYIFFLPLLTILVPDWCSDTPLVALP